jgi:hypothetical protein
MHHSKFSTLEYYIKGWNIKNRATEEQHPVVLHIINNSANTRTVNIYFDATAVTDLGYYIE